MQLSLSSLKLHLLSDVLPQSYFLFSRDDCSRVCTLLHLLSSSCLALFSCALMFFLPTLWPVLTACPSPRSALPLSIPRSATLSARNHCSPDREPIGSNTAGWGTSSVTGNQQRTLRETHTGTHTQRVWWTLNVVQSSKWLPLSDNKILWPLCKLKWIWIVLIVYFLCYNGL